MHIYIYNNGLNIWFTFNSPTERKKDAFERLPVGGKEKIRAILYIMDRFSISQEAYHELTQQESSMPKTYLVDSGQKVIDALWKSTKTPGICPGAELPFELLPEEEIRGHVRVFSKLHKKSSGCVWLVIYSSQT